MNYYEHHIGDYDQATAHLTACEDGIYSRLIRWYMASESPLPADVKLIQRRVRAHTREEKNAVVAILEEFFEITDDGYRQHRCDEEIERYRQTIPDREAKKENARERQQRARARRKELFEALRSHGVTPSFDTKTAELEELLSRVTKRDESQDVTVPITRDDTATQTPDTRHQLTPSTQQVASTPQPEVCQVAPLAAPPTRQGLVCRLLREAGVFEAAPHHLDAATWDALLAKRTDEEIVEFARAKLESRPGQRTSLRYLAPGLLEDPRPVESTGHRPAARTPRAENFHTKDYGQGGAL